MAKEETPQNGRDRLEKAMAMLIQHQTSFQSRVADTDSRMEQTDRRMEEMERATAERCARIEKLMTAILHVLADHGRLLERLPAAICDKIGFQGRPGPS